MKCYEKRPRASSCVERCELNGVAVCCRCKLYEWIWANYTRGWDAYYQQPAAYRLLFEYRAVTTWRHDVWRQRGGRDVIADVTRRSRRHLFRARHRHLIDRLEFSHSLPFIAHADHGAASDSRSNLLSDYYSPSGPDPPPMRTGNFRGHDNRACPNLPAVDILDLLRYGWQCCGPGYHCQSILYFSKLFHFTAVARRQQYLLLAAWCMTAFCAQRIHRESPSGSVQPLTVVIVTYLSSPAACCCCWWWWWWPGRYGDGSYSASKTI